MLRSVPVDRCNPGVGLPRAVPVGRSQSIGLGIDVSLLPSLLLSPRCFPCFVFDWSYQRPHVSISEATVFLGWSRTEMFAAIAAGEIEVTSTALGSWIWREELMTKALEVWPPDVIEDALGADADSVLPAGVRLAEV